MGQILTNHNMRKQAAVSLWISWAAFFCGLQGVWAESASERLGRAQLQSEQSFHRYYEALKSSPKKDPRALGQEILGPAKSRTLKVLDESNRESRRAVFNKYYTAKGAVIDPADFANTQSQSKAGLPGLKAGVPADAGYRKESGAPESGGIERPAYSLSGAGIPAELNFPGKAARPEKKRAAQRTALPPKH